MINSLEAEIGRRWPDFHQAKHLAAVPFLLASLDVRIWVRLQWWRPFLLHILNNRTPGLSSRGLRRLQPCQMDASEL
ncbi:hypothetical protein WJX84_007596 [Apatococcus fuscideae]|uniref:Uncharacterized protein n=1 Tax=Apatococcus fuscideae TaxID=2026836 RepID=A0AAW1RMH6_9CHLO